MLLGGCELFGGPGLLMPASWGQLEFWVQMKSGQLYSQLTFVEELGGKRATSKKKLPHRHLCCEFGEEKGRGLILIEGVGAGDWQG